MTNNRQKYSPRTGFVSLLWTGFFPKAPGTFASLISCFPLILLEYYQVSKPIIIAGFIFLVVLSSYLIHKIQLEDNLSDPSWIVIDEFLGMLLTWLIVPKMFSIPVHVAVIFLFFRLFDITKPWPISFIDQKLKNGFGVVFDDLVASLFAAIPFWIYFFIN